MSGCRLSSVFGTLLVAMTIFQAGTAAAQDTERSRLNTAAYYNYSEEGDITILVHVWGAVRFPGLYEVPIDSRFSRLMSLAGGPQLNERLSRQSRSVRVRIDRGTGGGRSVVFEQSMTNTVVVSDQDPVMRDGDVLTVESVLKQGISWRDVFPIIGAAASVALILERVTN